METWTGPETDESASVTSKWLVEVWAILRAPAGVAVALNPLG